MNADHTAIRLETVEGFQFTPRYGPDRRPTIWNPDEWNGTIPRSEVHAAWDEINRRYRLQRVYYDPWKWESEAEGWAQTYGTEIFFEWFTNRERAMYGALDQFTTDLATGAITHDGCPITAQQVANARKAANKADRYILAKPSQAQKIDAAVTSVICHKAAADARALGWGTKKPRKNARMIVIR